jgi:hypothetical protein
MLHLAHRSSPSGLTNWEERLSVTVASRAAVPLSSLGRLRREPGAARRICASFSGANVRIAFTSTITRESTRKSAEDSPMTMPS